MGFLAWFGLAVTWVGGLFAEAAMWLTLSTVPTAWSTHHHIAYVLLLLAAITFGALTVLAPLAYGAWAARFWLWAWRAAKAWEQPGLMVDIAAVPRVATDRREFVFTTNKAPQRLIATPHRPTGLRITVPFEASVPGGSLPATVRHCGKMIFRVEQFVAEGFVIGAQSPGLRIEGHVSYSDLPAHPQEPS